MYGIRGYKTSVANTVNAQEDGHYLDTQNSKICPFVAFISHDRAC